MTKQERIKQIQEFRPWFNHNQATLRLLYGSLLLAAGLDMTIEQEKIYSKGFQKLCSKNVSYKWLNNYYKELYDNKIDILYHE